uniref:MIT domain-containing protein n=1 Tax=Plectus sambesii TaxID=2011161 RepID=A0A914V5D9_9BILA
MSGSDEAALLGPAALVLRQAYDMDVAKRSLEALALYREGIAILLDVMKPLAADSPKRQKLRTRVEEYMTRAEKLKKLIERDKSLGKFHQQIRVANDSTGFGYARIFVPLVDEELTQVVVEDSYIRKHHQILNFIRFCELLVKSAPSLKGITLITGADESDKDGDLPGVAFKELKQSLAAKNIDLTVQFSSSLHDREIRFDNGWIVKIGRGLDYFKACPKYSIGSCDMDLRPCHETTIDILHKQSSS